MNSTTRLFNPLTGDDLKKVLINDFTQKLEGSVLLQPHLTFPLVTYKIELTIESYPMNEAEIVRVEKTIGSTESAEGKEPKIDKIVYSRNLGEDQETAPDKLREENSIPVLQPERDPSTGRMVDKEQKVRQSKSVSVGKGTTPRKTTKVEPVAEPLLDDEGNPVKMNSV